MTKQKIIRSGHSLVVTVPSCFVKSVGIKAGDEVVVEAKSETGQVTYSFSGIKQLSFARNFLKKKRS